MKYLLILLLSLATQLLAYDYKAKVVGVMDGDTIKVLDSNNVQHKIRLYGIDAPEKKQAFGEKSKLYLSSLIFGKEVTVRVVNKDRYGREVASVFYKNEPSVNLEMLSAGYAWAYLSYIKKRFRPLYQEYEWLAKKDKKGLWADPNPTPPWEFRRNKKKK